MTLKLDVTFLNMTSLEKTKLNDLLVENVVNNNLLAVRKSLKDGADVNSTLDYNKTILIYSAIHRYKDILRYLITKGADVNRSTDIARKTALHWMCIHNDFYEVRRLVEAGADVNVRDAYGVTPLDYAKLPKINGNKLVITFLEKLGAESK